MKITTPTTNAVRNTRAVGRRSSTIETRADEGEAEDRRPDRKPDALLVPRRADCQQVEDCDDEPERKRRAKTASRRAGSCRRRAGRRCGRPGRSRRRAADMRETLSRRLERLDELLLEPGEVAVDGEVAAARLVQVEVLVVEVLGHVEARAEHEPQVVERT